MDRRSEIRMGRGPTASRIPSPPHPPRRRYSNTGESVLTDFVSDLYLGNAAISGICVSPSMNKYQKYYRKCEYCSTINNVS